MSNVQESYTSYSAKMLTEGTTVLSKAEYRFAMELISQAQSGNYSGCDEAVYKLLYLDRINNSVIQAAALAWAIAQALKVILTLCISRRFDSSRMFGSGGMPSSHSALVCAMLTVIGFKEGFSSSVFALAFCFAGITMYDAAGVRRSAGRNAAVINHMLDDLATRGFFMDEERLKELVGHTPIQVMAGALLGIFIGTLIA